jgi:RHH-type transcriptional regulator, proline utilization regulon repressor / proline dehydrogenase / delta 1-pyrroline-5-carboxylate dehydrogenase
MGKKVVTGGGSATAPSDVDALADQAVEQVKAWLSRASVLHRRGHPSSKRLADLLKDPHGPAFAQGFVDRVLRPEDLSVAARNLREIGAKPPAFLAGPLATLVRLGAFFAPFLPGIVVPIARRAFRVIIGHLIIDANPKKLGRRVLKLGRRGDTLNINLLGEAVLGHGEAARRLAGVTRLVRRSDVSYVSVKVSAVVAQLSMWAFEDSVDRVVATLLPLYREAASQESPTFINLDMEEYKDLELTLEVFTRIMADKDLLHYRAGIVLQAYLPDSLPAMKRLNDFAAKRLAKGGAPIKVRVVKGANLPMEQVDGAIHDWPVAVWPTKQDSDAHYKRVIEWAMRPERVRCVNLGIAGHNLFDLAFSHHLKTSRGITSGVDVEMLLGMAPDQADAVRETVGPLVLYTPVVEMTEFDAAVGYLIRRLEENASSENFMSAVFDLSRSEDLFAREEKRFRDSLATIAHDPPERLRTQNRNEAEPSSLVVGQFRNEPDTDPSLLANQDWLKKVRKAATTKKSFQQGEKTLQKGSISDLLGPIEGQIAVDDLVATMREGAALWRKKTAAKRAEVLYEAAQALSAARADLLTVMMQEAGKTIAEGDPEISEAIDFARYYANQAIEWEDQHDVSFHPVGLTVVAPPWNFPVAIPTGSVTAALAAGSAVIIKPAPQVKRCAAVMVEALWAAGVPKNVLWLADVSESDLGRSLMSHPGVDRVVLTGGFDTAKLFRSWRADLPLIAETSGKNAIVITPSADFDIAVADLAKSAFGHAGQKCSAASLAILVGSVADSARFRRQLVDAVTSLRVGYPDDPATVMGPIIEPPAAKLLGGLTELGPQERWLLQPQQLDDSGRLWSPGIRLGVSPGSTFHQVEYFGPVLGLIRARNLDEAVRVQNGVNYGLTAGIHSLDPSEVAWWVDRVEAGNLYVNRGITGAIVRRQSFGGWKRSAVGATAKAGGPHYLTAFGTFDRRRREELPVAVAPNDPFVREIVEAASAHDGEEERNFLLRAVASDEEAWVTHFGRGLDESGVGVERNIFRYRPATTTIRASALTPVSEIARVILAARSVGASVELSVTNRLPEDFLRALTRAGKGNWQPSAVVVEGELDFVKRVATSPPARIRLLRGSEAVMQVHFDGNPEVAIWSGPVTESGRVEALPFVLEQAVSMTVHRFGTLDPRFVELAESLEAGSVNQL